jgi:predicted ATPase/class 3 adenylate cyclase
VRELPVGTVTFLFTDIEGSTRLLQELGDAYANALREHSQTVENAVSSHGGAIVDTQGDAFFVAFARAGDAVAAAEDAQRALDIPVRMGIHTGEPGVSPSGYTGMDVHRAARICSAAHGGQVVVSETTQRLLQGRSARDLRDLGRHRLKDLTEPMRLYQVGEGHFPPLRSLNTTNLPVQPTPLVGRERELEELLTIVRESRLVTLTGPGGAGKTRLALQAAAELVEELPDGVFFVALAPVDRPELVIQTIAKTLELREVEDETIEETLERHLADRRLLLVLDNFERLLEASRAVARVLSAAAEVKALVTSRARLHLAGEREYPVPPLSDRDGLALFQERAQSVVPHFHPTEEDTAAVGAICRHLDGLPLAIELAAARTKLLPPSALLTRLEQRLPLLTGGAQDLPTRQRTLRATIDWSYDLLDASEQQLFRRLGVFAGGCTLEAAEAVCGASIDELESLLDKSLLRTGVGTAGDARIAMLQTIREYATEHLDEAGEANEMRLLHARHYCALAEASEPEILGSDQAAWLGRLQDELDNFRGALTWSLEHDRVELAVRLIGSLRRAWIARGYVTETRTWLEAALARAHAVAAPFRAKALYGLGRAALVQGDYAYAISRLEESAALFRDLDDAQGVVYALADLGWIATMRAEGERAQRLATESLASARTTGDKTLIAAAVHSLACAALEQRDYEEARALFEESLALRRSVGDDRNVSSSLEGTGLVALLSGDYDGAAGAFEEGLSLGRELDNRPVIAAAVGNLGLVSLLRGDVDQAESYSTESIGLCRDIGEKRGVIQDLHTLAGVAAAKGELARAATLACAVDGLHDAIQAPPWAAEQIVEERLLGTVRQRLHEPELERAAARGRAMGFDEVIAFALGAGAGN